jgi:hypothetical protein
MSGRRRSRFPRWVREQGGGFTIRSQHMLPAMARREQPAPEWDSERVLSAQPTAKVEVICERCGRRGRFTAFRLFALYGDKHGRPLMLEIAKSAGCDRAKNPPPQDDMKWAEKACQIREIRPADDIVVVPTIYGRMHAGWRLFIICGRDHQGFKSARPCPGPPVELHLPTLVASLGHKFTSDELYQQLVTPCCESRQFALQWASPEDASRLSEKARK